MRRLVLIAATAVLALGLASPAPASTITLRPGERVVSGLGSCTLNFVYDGTGSVRNTVFLGTAAHCIDQVGDRVRDSNGVAFGTVVVRGDPDDLTDDWALIRVDSEDVARVSAAVKGHPTYPKGVTSRTETYFGDLIQLSGYGVGFSVTSVTREERVGTLTYDDADEHAVIAPAVFGDSGGPIVHIRTGKALGIVSRLCLGTCTEIGPTVEGILAKAKASGFPVVLRTA